MKKRKRKVSSTAKQVDFSDIRMPEEFKDTEKFSVKELLGKPLLFLFAKEFESVGGQKFKAKMGRVVKAKGVDKLFWRMVKAKDLKRNKLIRFNASGVLAGIFKEFDEKLPFTGKIMSKKVKGGHYYQLQGLKG